MKEAIIQFWEESERGWGVRPDGASIHLNIESCKSYIDEIYSKRDSKNVPFEYDRIIGSPIEVKINADIFDILVNVKNIRFPQYQLNNLIKLKDIILD